MMKRIRRNVFETNSSSMHSVSIKHTDNVHIDKCLTIDLNDNKVVVEFDQFGWGLDSYWDAQTKLNYIITMIGENSSSISEFYESEDFKKVEDCVNTFFGSSGIKLKEGCCKDAIFSDGEAYLSMNGYIDHQSVYRCIDDFLNDNVVDLADFIFNPNVTLIIDNDNR